MYTEYFIEYDNELLTVYLDGLTPDGFWEEIATYDEINSPEDFAHGLSVGLPKGSFVTISPVTIEDE